MRRTALLLALGLLASAAARAGEPAGARDATANLYARMSANDLAGVSRYLPADGFTELGEGPSTPHRLDAAAFAGLFKSGARIALRVTDLQVQAIGDAAVVTGVRVGSVTPPGDTAVEMSAPFTMVWTQAGAHGEHQQREAHILSQQMHVGSQTADDIAHWRGQRACVGALQQAIQQVRPHQPGAAIQARPLHKHGGQHYADTPDRRAHQQRKQAPQASTR